MIALLTFSLLLAVEAEPKTANEHYNEGLRKLRTIEGPLRAGKLSPEQLTVAQGAETDFRTALKLAPNHGRAHINLAMLYRFTNRFQEAIPHLKRGMTLKEGSKDWLSAAGTLVDVYFNQNKPKPAIPVLEKIVKYEKKDAQVHYQLGIAHYYAGSKGKAKKWLKKALAIDPSHQQAQTLLNTINQG
ncbi:MAG: tetratricopeptide repeat protein [Myxococcota bacterium]